MNKRFTYINKVAFGQWIHRGLAAAALLLLGGMAQAQTSGVSIVGSVFGGGNEAAVGRGTTVCIDQNNASIGGDVYGGGALAQVDTVRKSPTPPNATDEDYITVSILQGHVEGNVYGGGLGDSTVYGGSANVAAHVYGPVYVSIGNSNGGSASFGDNSMVFGGNNLNGTPKDNISVDIWSTAHGADPAHNLCPTDNDLMAYASPNDQLTPADVEANTSTQTYALKAVYGGGNKASYTPLANKSASVHIHNCDNTIEDVYGGGNAANVGILDSDTGTEGNQTISANTSLTIDGGRIKRVFGGGNGYSATGNHNDPSLPDYNPGANIYGTATTTIHGGLINEVFGGSNSYGDITTMALNLDHTGSTCSEVLVSIFGGANESDIHSDVTLTISCGSGAFKEVYGGSNKANIFGDVTLNIYGGTIEEAYGGSKGTAGTPANIDGNVGLNLYGGEITNAFGGSNINGNITGSITVNVNDQEVENCGLGLTNVYGAGNLTAYTPTDASTVHPEVNVIKGAISGNVFGGGLGSTATVTANPKVTVSGGSIGGSVYGGGEAGDVNGNTVVSISDGTLGSAGNLVASTLSNVFGGGLGASTQVTGDVEVNISGGTIYGDVYGGSALGSVNTNGDNTTTVNVTGGTLETHITTGTANNEESVNIYNGGNVYGGGLGNADHAAAVNGVVTVNIGSGTVTNDLTEVSDAAGTATIKGNVYGCNNANGSPQENVTVNIFKMAEALPNVFGGGNQADFLVDGKTANVNIYTCDNEIGRTFGGGNAAATKSVRTMIQGGTITEVYGGGNGEVSPANVNGSVTLHIHGGDIGQTFAGSNQQGSISGGSTVSVDNEGPCSTTPLDIDEFFCGGNYANISSSIDATIACSDGYIHNLYGGCNQANVVSGSNVTLTVEGGEYDYIYGGSKGTLTTPADIAGNVTLNIYGGTIHNAIFGGCNINGSIGGTIIVNVEDKGNTGCNLDASTADVYGGGNLAAYTAPNATPNYPEVNIIHGTVKNVYGGGLGATAVVTGNPKVTVGGTAASHRAVVRENIYGGGNAAQVTGNTEVQLTQRAKVFGNVYGGGNEAEVTGNTKVIVNGATQQQP